MEITGKIIEIGQLDGENGSDGIVMETRDDQLITIKGLDQDQVRRLAGNFLDYITINFKGLP